MDRNEAHFAANLANAAEPSSPSPPCAAAPGEDRRTPPDNVLTGLGQPFHGAALQFEFDLATSLPRQIFRRDFVYLSRQLYALELSRRVTGLDRALLNAALAAVTRQMNTVGAMLRHCHERSRALSEAHGYANTVIEFKPRTAIRATLVSRYTRDFIGVLQQADAAMIELEKAWMLGLVSLSERDYRQKHCRHALRSIKEVVRQQRHRIGQEVRRINEQRANGGG